MSRMCANCGDNKDCYKTDYSTCCEDCINDYNTPPEEKAAIEKEVEENMPKDYNKTYEQEEMQ